jgi:hypothetical protein
MDRKVPSEITKRLNRWNFHSRVLRISHFVLVHVFNIHLGTAFIERRHQARKLVGDEI